MLNRFFLLMLVLVMAAPVVMSQSGANDKVPFRVKAILPRGPLDFYYLQPMLPVGLVTTLVPGSGIPEKGEALSCVPRTEKMPVKAMDGSEQPPTMEILVLKCGSVTLRIHSVDFYAGSR